MAKKTEKITLYGEIADWNDNSGAAFAQRFAEAAKKASAVELHIHCPGGDVFEGNVIYNTIVASEVPVDVYIDGVAASMASVVMLAGRKIYMAENAFVMIHAPSSWINGNADDLEKAAKLLRSIEDNFVKAYCRRTGKDEAETREWMKGDNWFSAQEALDAGLIDGIVEACDTKDIDIEQESVIRQSNEKALLERYRAKINKVPTNQNKHQMTKEKKAELIAKWKLTGVTADSSDEQIENAISAKMQEKDIALAEEKKAKIEAMVDEAVAAGKIAEAQKPTYTEIGTTLGAEKLKELFAGMQTPQLPKNSVMSQIENHGDDNAQRNGWDWDRWQKEDPRGLERLKTEEPETFEKLYKAKYNN